MFHDSYGREVNYIRLSVTDRCNLQCFYCRTDGCVKFIPHENVLSYEEMLRLVKAAEKMNVSKLRLTGGEPFVRKDFLAFLGMLKEECPKLDVRITTNGTLLGGKVPALKHLGIKRINISLDTLKAEKFKEITSRDFLPRVERAIDDCLHYGLTVKINVVAMRGVNDNEIRDFVKLAKVLPVDIRFIEFMPIGGCSHWKEGYAISAKEILQEAQSVAKLTPLEKKSKTDGPARLYSIQNGEGRIGMISAMSDHFCKTCNRLRITSDGRLRTCLFSDKEYKLRPALRNSRLDDDQLLRIMQRATESKPLGYKLLEKRLNSASVCTKAMSSIGG
ncbi:GTP 3',8-cyclase MoaA [Desulfobaculum bizertense]|uniref:GTP 3',8-cyclase n=1 Tax=Desulfobaculum bizertense DSM 18034 TaxID=1121442 RepID=A0A1T4WPR5_9BACT|nr:GTP 3',8-cyclase MoaA [Desulfobaculum bizertense]SKA78848.1 cyclic pyranopterin monophosphate synthase subunit MoaA [Desulfobaculum bizertense DSM 18034]